VKDLLTLFEYNKVKYEQCFSIDDEGVNDDNIKVFLTEKTLQNIERINQTQKFLEISRKEIRALNYVGVARVGSLRIEILPKFIADNDDDSNKSVIMHNLIHMLKYSKMVNIKELSYADLHKKKDFFEIMVFLYGKNLLNVLKKNQEWQYFENEDEQRFVREKILTHRYGINPAQLHIIPCRYHERGMNTLINHTLKYATYLMVKEVREIETFALLKQIISVLDDVELAPISLQEIEHITYTRLNKEFKPYVEFCKLFLSQSTLTLQASNIEFFSLMIPMEKLFQEFISEMILLNQIMILGSSNQQVFSQHRIGYLAHREALNQFELKPDIFIKGKDGCVILDIKYKMLDEEDRKFGLSQTDLYQMYAYCKESGATKSMLLYPKGLNSNMSDVVFHLGKSNEIELRVVSLSLHFDLSTKEGMTDFLIHLKDKLTPLFPLKNINNSVAILNYAMMF